MADFVFADPRVTDGLEFSLQTFASNDLTYMDGVCATRQIIGVTPAGIRPWMTGTRWNLRHMRNGYWAIQNQWQAEFVLGIVAGDQIGLVPMDMTWPETSQMWRLLTNPMTGKTMLQNKAGGYLCLVGNSLSLAIPGTMDDATFQWSLTEPVLLTSARKAAWPAKLSSGRRVKALLRGIGRGGATSQ